MQAAVYSGVTRLPALLICARSSRPRACGGGPSSARADAVDREVDSSSEVVLDKDLRRAGIGWEVEVDSTVCEIVVVALAVLLLVLWCWKTTFFFIGCGGSEGASELLLLISSSWLRRGDPVVIVVATD